MSAAVLRACLVLVSFSSLLWNGLALDSFESPLPSHMLMPVHLGDSADLTRVKRQSGPIEKNQPLRILPIYASTIAQDLQGKVTLIQDTIIPKVLDFVQQSFSVAPLPGPILLNNNCTTNSIRRNPNTGAITCVEFCAPTRCGAFQVPTDHLKVTGCVLHVHVGPCLSTSRVGSPAEDGAGVSGYDFVLYITADASLCPQSAGGGTTTVAVATSCQSEALQDRPIAGAINFCQGVQNEDADFAFAVTKHEILHALGFASFHFALWRDPATNEPRTARNPNTGLPDGFVTGSSTVEAITYTDWYTAAGTVNHQVTRLVTPAVVAEGRRHFNCPSLGGVELENQGGPGTAMDHWEKRLLGNEAMTGLVTFNPVFSRFTFAAFEDSGWYRVNYSLADELVWGQGAGCRFAEGNCGEWIQTQTDSNNPLAPFCNTLQDSDPIMLSCTADHEAVSRCNKVVNQFSVPSEYRYFEGPANLNAGGSFTIADFCPIQDVFNIRFSDGLRGTTCSIADNQPPSTQLLESFGGKSRCVRHGRQWRFGGSNVDKYGGGCYQYTCTEDAVTITVGSQSFTCSCSQAGQEMLVDQRSGNNRVEGSIICPECFQICHAQSTSIRIGATGGIAPNGSNSNGSNGSNSNGSSGSPSLHCSSISILVLITTVLTCLLTGLLTGLTPLSHF